MSGTDPSRPDPSLMRTLGLVTGDLWAVLAGKRPQFTQKQVVRREVQEREIPADRGTLVLRRTTVDEVELRPGLPAPADIQK